MLATFFLILPVFLVIGIGHILWRTHFVAADFWPAAEKIAYFILMPAIIVRTLGKSDLAALDLTGSGGGVLLIVGAVSALVFASRLVVRLPGPVFASVYQSTIRLNGFVGLSIILSLFGDAGVAQLSVFIAIWVPLANFLSIYVFVREGGGGKRGAGHMANQIIRNPLVMAVFAGIAINLAGLGTHIDRFPILDLLGRAGLTLGLLTVGAGLDFQALRRAGARVMAATAVKLAVMPAIAAVVCALLVLDSNTTAALIIFASLPTSATGHILARQLGGDVDTMTSIIALQTALSLITVTGIAALVS